MSTSALSADTLGEPLGFDPAAPYDPDNQPPLSEQLGFFRYAVMEAAQAPDSGRLRAGPFHSQFFANLQVIDTAAAKIDPRITPDMLALSQYQQAETRQRALQLSSKANSGLDMLRDQYSQLNRDLARTAITPAMQDQTIPAGILSTPPLCRQGDGERHILYGRLCFNACFRMVLRDIVQWHPEEAALARAMKEQYGNPVAHGQDYLKIFDTEIFSEISTKKVSVASFIGADFNTIRSLAETVRARRPDAAVYSIVSLLSDSSHQILHTNILLGADSEDVYVLDPSTTRPPREHIRDISRDRFIRRWAGAMNGAHVVIARDA